MISRLSSRPTRSGTSAHLCGLKFLPSDLFRLRSNGGIPSPSSDQAPEDRTVATECRAG
ncbi:hypothetical protein KFK09_001471 [Dendrobium nobile]|uniref:Uncharacterized protein n=1 Tax=Dendrobium nobile TaxID=94219 RepID=A0A8T3C7F2_DENNO|nr:hypothetical protein KFK09_001471 [Dendrobium nobile]